MRALMVRSSSSINCLTCPAISGGNEKVMISVVLGMCFLPSIVILGLTLIMDETGRPVKGRSPV